MLGGQISLLSGCHKAKELDASFLGDSGGIMMDSIVEIITIFMRN